MWQGSDYLESYALPTATLWVAYVRFAVVWYASSTARLHQDEVYTVIALGYVWHFLLVASYEY